MCRLVSLRNMFQHCVEKQHILDPDDLASSFGELAHETEKLMPIITRSEVGR